MKFIVDSLPYYGDECPFSAFVYDSICYDNKTKCPRYWDKEFICSNDNPHECEFLIEFNTYIEKGKDKEIYITIDNNSPCKYFTNRSLGA